MTTSTTRAKKAIKGAAALAFWLAVWFIVSEAVGQELILPSPYAVLMSAVRLGGTAEFWLTALNSLKNIVIGFLTGALAGILLSAATSWSGALDTLLSPVIRIIRATPVASFIILALLWTGKNRVPSLMSAMMVAPVVWGSLTAAIGQTDKELLEMAAAYRFGRLKTLLRVYVPSVLPALGAALAASMGLAWKSGIAAEVLCQARSTVGAELYFSKIYLETPALFAWTAVVVILSLILEGAIKKALAALGGRQSHD